MTLEVELLSRQYALQVNRKSQPLLHVIIDQANELAY